MKCLICGEDIVKKPNEGEKYFITKKYCSKSCYGESKKGLSPWNKGKKGLQIAWNKGKIGYRKQTLKWKKEQSNRLKKQWKSGIRKIEFPRRYKEEHHAWRGIKAKYGSKHDWIRHNYGKATKCENRENNIFSFKCSEKSQNYEWANKNGEYLREVEDYYQLCRSCHSIYDKSRK